MELPRLMLITKDQRTFNMFYKQLFDYFEDTMEILSHEDEREIQSADLVLTSSSKLPVNQFIPNDKLLVARRAIDISRLEQLVTLPAGTRCLVVNNMLETALETIELLSNLGFDFQMYPYYPGMTEKLDTGIKVAIIPEGLEMVPEGMEQVMNIGVRPMDFSTLIEIAVRLKLNVDKANIYTARYIQEIIRLSRRFFHTMHHVNELNHQLDAILNTVHDGIVATDSSGKIIQINQSARKILGVKRPDEDIIGNLVEEIFPKFSAVQAASHQENLILSLDGVDLVVNKTPIEAAEQKRGEVIAFQDVTQIQKLEQDLRKELQGKGLSSKYTIEDIIGRSTKIRDTLHTLEKIAKTDRTVLILGENGTGKELFAHTIHHLSSRRNGPFLPVNFAGLPESLAESELFGYEDGAFTGAKKGGKPGLFEMAHNGTIFLDEIGDASPSLQALLLRVLQEKQVMRIGGRRVIPIHVRVIAATNRNLKEMVEQGKFRQDLYYRLFVLPLRVPSLRERKEDIPLLIEHFIREYCVTKVDVSDEVMERLVHYHWPGNIRELVSVVQYMTSVMEESRVYLVDLPEQFKEHPPTAIPPQEDYMEVLEKNGELQDYYVILSCLEQAKAKRESVGRGRIVHYSIEKDVPLTDQQVRSRMQTLGQLGLLYSGTRGQGSRITMDGLFALKQIEKKLGISIEI
ncbi:sigma-54 interaction domain-containing protein [Aneurinibacillus tyrosinisolvens]|uniref:sigma-54 interaction domain-containing protein n=1 Tax=Aneurinibacillus tyrosinisolvens TaxID=1443435 RepID=UPI00063F7EFE|nr:sigma 54-interacting transcriptional regulator [Aneurinibacillus tyrosinisolvens]